MSKLKQRIEMLEEGENKDLWNMIEMTDKINEAKRQSEINRENLMLLMDYLDVHLEHIDEKAVVENDDY
jgi:hypothetical protein